MGNFEEIVMAEKRKAMKTAREAKSKYNPDFYLLHKFANAEDKTFFENEVALLHRSMDQFKQIEVSKTETALNIGSHAIKLRKKIIQINEVREKKSKKRISIKKYFEAHFKTNSSRIYECIAANKAIKLGADKDTSISTLIILGQNLNSKNEAKKSATLEVLKNNELSDGTPLNQVPAKSIQSKLRGSLPKQDTCWDRLEKILNITSNLQKEIKSYQGPNSLSSLSPEERNKLFNCLTTVEKKLALVEEGVSDLRRNIQLYRNRPDPVQ